MAQMNGKTPEVMANEIINAAVIDKAATISGTSFQKLETITRYDNRDKINAKGENWYTKNSERLITDSLETLITNRAKALKAYVDKKDNDDKRKSFLDLVARGLEYKEAVEKTGYNPDFDTKK